MSNIKLFENKRIRSAWNEKEQLWYFSVQDVIQVLTDTPNPSDYIKKMRKRDEELSKGWGQIVTPLPVDTPGGKQNLRYMYLTFNFQFSTFNLLWQPSAPKTH
jgi:hypothetical protein